VVSNKKTVAITQPLDEIGDRDRLGVEPTATGIDDCQLDEEFKELIADDILPLLPRPP